MNRLSIVVGLGNPGARYRSTRHNLGFRVLDRLAAQLGVRFRAAAELSDRAWTAEALLSSERVVLAKPRTFMNRSGRAGVALCRHYDADPRQLLVVFDDADLELGRLRIRSGGSPGGHNGMSSLIDALRTTEIPRVRLGVRGVNRGDGELADYVLAPFAPEEEPLAEDLADLAVDAVQMVIREGLSAAMNRYNTKPESRVERVETGDEGSEKTHKA